MAIPPAPSWRSVLLHWEPDVLGVLIVALLVAYATGVVRLAERGRRWPPARTAAFTAGVACIALATQSGLAAYDTVAFSLHAVQHLLLGMVGPLLLALSAPVTLTLQASGRPTRTRLLRGLHGRGARTLTNPFVAFALFGGGLVVVYLSPLYELSLRSEGVHLLVHVHFLVAGTLLYAVLVGVDPLPRRDAHAARLLLAFLALPLHTFVAVALTSARTPIAEAWYADLGRTWAPDLLADQRLGAGLLWVAGEILGVVTLGIVAWQWMRHDERVARRHDAAAARQLLADSA